ncbi:DEAD/DEAH box helicase family protein, partial [Ruminococcus sp.]|uniref:DEAD/DEAH box helicase family protein n=1 Tax=Ruminococcus sp. TaxID=41978 RepID=UPI0025D550C3
NLRDSRIYDRVEQPDGKITSVLNKKETMIAQEKQEAIKNAFRDWIFKDPDRREKLVTKYNVLFNSTKPREYDGSHIKFSGMTPEIKLRPHQLNAIAHVMYGENTLLAHQVGAGKSFEMIASAMESKRLGLCTKSLFVVPNHLTEQMGAEFLRLYPAANILVATKKDFEAKNRKRLCSRIATGDYDAVIIGHSQLEKIPVSAERQERIIRKQINEITEGIESLSRRRGDSFSIKQLEKTKKNLEAKLDKLSSMERDDVVTFEELGIDKMFVDEAHSFKNLFLYTKMRNVAGIQQTEAQKSSDLYMKCQYLDELTGGKGCTFATGTPISNSMTELYTMMRYLQANKLKEMGMHNFDAWAANFGEAVTAIELAPEGTGYRAKTRFSKFFNLPELINVFKECADIKTADMLNLPVPEAEFHNIVVKPSDIQKDMVEGLSERAKRIHDKEVAPEEDNMLKVTNDGRKIGLDQRLIDPLLPDEPDSKVNACVANVLDIYHKHDDTKATQLIFCDFSTPKNDGSFNLYDDIRNKLVANGVPKDEVVFIHEAESETKKKELFSKIRKGQVRVLIGSTAKCGAGTNIQDKLIALHHLDCPWRPSDLERAPVKAA